MGPSISEDMPFWPTARSRTELRGQSSTVLPAAFCPY